MKNSWFVLGFLFSFVCGFSQIKKTEIRNLDSLMMEQKKPIFVLITANHCAYCQLQKKQLSKNSDFIKNQQKFYFVEFNSEDKIPVVFNKKNYVFKPSGLSSGVHQLATFLNASEILATPTWVLLDANYQVLFRYAGVLSKEQLRTIVLAL